MDTPAEPASGPDQTGTANREPAEPGEPADRPEGAREPDDAEPPAAAPRPEGERPPEELPPLPNYPIGGGGSGHTGWGGTTGGWGGGGWGWPTGAPQPGIIPLRPLTAGEIVQGAIAAVRFSPRVMLGFSAVVALVGQVVQVALLFWLLHGVTVTNPPDGQPRSISDSSVRAQLTSSGITTVIQLITDIILIGVLTLTVSQAVLGRRMRLREAWEQVRPRLPALLGVTLLVVLIEVVVGGLCLAPGLIALAAGADNVARGLLVIGGIAAAVLVIYLAIALSFATASLILEEQRVRQALRRSFDLVRGSWWRVFGITLLVTIISAVVAGVIGVPFTVAGSPFGGSTHPGAFMVLLMSGIGGVIASTIVAPFEASGRVLLYVDRRMRAEGLDQELARAAEEHHDA